MNVITIAGNITKDAEIRYLPSGEPVANFTVADNQGKDKQAIFWNCGLFGKRADSLSKYLTTGSAVTVTGDVTQREYKDRDGVDRKVFDVRVQNVALQGGKREEAGQQGAAKPSGKVVDWDDTADVPF